MDFQYYRQLLDEHSKALWTISEYSEKENDSRTVFLSRSTAEYSLTLGISLPSFPIIVFDSIQFVWCTDISCN